MDKFQPQIKPFFTPEEFLKRLEKDKGRRINVMIKEPTGEGMAGSINAIRSAYYLTDKTFLRNKNKE